VTIDRYDIAMLVPGLPFDGRTVTSRSLGGSESAGYYLGRALAARGHRVTVFATPQPGLADPGEYDGVTYRPIDQWAAYSTSVPSDVTIVQRAPEAFRAKLASRYNILWCHDLAMGRQGPGIRGVLWNIDDVAVLSAFMAEQYAAVYGPDVPTWRTRNGVDLATAEAARDGAGPRRRRDLVYMARPERGLDVLLRDVLPRVLAHVPDARLLLCAYENPVEHLAPFYAECQRLAQGLGDRVVWAGALSKPALYRLLWESGVYVYPGPSPVLSGFAEVSCLAVMEAMACGLPVVATTWGALPETLAPAAGILIEPGRIETEHGRPVAAHWTPESLDAFAAAAVDTLTNDPVWEKMSAAGPAHATGLDWSGVAAQWEARIAERLAALNDSPARLARHFVRRSDIIAAKAIMDRETCEGCDGTGRVCEHPEYGECTFCDGIGLQWERAGPRTLADAKSLAEVRDRIRTEWYFVDDPETFAAHYRKIGDTHTDVFAQVPNEPRFQHAEAWLRARPQLQRLLDFGCAHGGYLVNLANRLPGRTWVGVDVDARSIAWCETNRATHAIEPDRLRFLEGGHTVDLSGEAPFDGLLAMEVLEHVPDPTVVIEALERWVQPGGQVLVTVPYGPWEYLSYTTYPYRCHLWEYDRHDLRDLLGAKRDLQIEVMSAGRADVLDEPLGWHIVTWTVDPERPTGRIDLARKLRLQRPRQTVSAAIIAGPQVEQTLGWCLASLAHVADEIVIADTGLSPMARAIAESSHARLVPGSSPLVHGFEAPRNEARDACRMDWMLWIDTDERLIEPEHLHKYLRGNAYHGYSLKQHHFAVDTTFPPDLPVRLIRLAPYQGPLSVTTPEGDTIVLAGRVARHYGMIHEHPELALNCGPGPTVVISDAHLFHVGYEVESRRRERFFRNLPLLIKDRERYPTRLLGHHFVIRDLILLSRYELQETGGQRTPDVRARIEEVKRLYREYFLGRGTYLGPDSRGYYSEALAMLGEGVEVAWTLAADKGQAHLNGSPKRARFATVEEAQREIAREVAEAIGPLTSATW